MGPDKNKFTWFLTGADCAEIYKPISKSDNLYNYVDVLAAWKINFTISNVTTFAMHNQESFNFRRPLPPIPPSEKHECTILWLSLKAFVYHVCHSQFFHVHHILAHNIIRFSTSVTVPDGQTFKLDCLHTTKHGLRKGSRKMKSNTFKVKHPMLHSYSVSQVKQPWSRTLR